MTENSSRLWREPHVVDIQFGMKKPGADRALLVVKLSNGAIEIWDVG